MHGRSDSPEYRSWDHAIQRCHNEANDRYQDYGGRGIVVCDRWRESFALFLEDMGVRPAGTTLDRIDNDGNYEPGNCRWATKEKQYGNQRHSHYVSVNGERLTVSEAARRLGINKSTLAKRLSRGWPESRALSAP